MTRVGRGKAGRARGASNTRAARADTSGKAAGARSKSTAGKRGASVALAADDPLADAHGYLLDLEPSSVGNQDLDQIRKCLEILTESVSGSLDSYDARLVVLAEAQKELNALKEADAEDKEEAELSESASEAESVDAKVEEDKETPSHDGSKDLDQDEDVDMADESEVKQEDNEEEKEEEEQIEVQDEVQDEENNDVKEEDSVEQASKQSSEREGSNEEELPVEAEQESAELKTDREDSIANESEQDVADEDVNEPEKALQNDQEMDKDEENNDETSKEVQADSEDDVHDDENENEASDKEYEDSIDLKEAVDALGLFKEESDSSSDPEYLKKLYGVASYPTVDIQDLLPGKIPDEDFTRAKPPNQVQFTTFATYIEPFFRPYVEEDVSFLKQRAVGLEGQQYIQPYALSISPFIIPSLGPYYADVWTAEDAAIGNKMTYTPKPLEVQKRQTSFQPKGSEEVISDAVLETEKVSVGPLASRLLSALISEAPEAVAGSKDDANEFKNEVKNEPVDDITGGAEDLSSSSYKGPAFIDSDQNWKVGTVKADYASLENRLKREFRYVGILDVNLLREEERKKKLVEAITNSAAASIGNSNGSVAAGLIAAAAGEDEDMHNGDEDDEDEEEYDIDWINGREDDEICVELRALQKNLRQAARVNQQCKRRLIPLVQEQMAYQEYIQILEDLDKQVDQAYLRRIRNTPKSKKKKANSGAVASTAPAGASASSGGNDGNKSGLRALLDKRQRWVEKIGPVFRPAHLMKRMPVESIFKGIEDEEDEEEDYVL